MLKFAVSVSWRSLNLLREMERLSHFTAPLLEDVDLALQTWSEYLLDRRPHPGRFEQHMLLLDSVGNHTFSSLPLNINRYLLRSIEIDAASTGTQAFVYTKMCRVVLVGFIAINKPRQWLGTKLRVSFGRIGEQTYALPDSFGTYLLERARKAGGLYKKVSPKQAEKISASYRQDMERAARSETWRAMDHDVQLFGRRAFND